LHATYDAADRAALIPVDSVHPLEKHWRQITVVSLLLLPLSVLFLILTWIRRTAFRLGLFRVVSAPVPVVVVGNISVGGTGKTPVVIWLAKELEARGFTPGVISRGYGGSEEVAAVHTTSSPSLVGDEPVLIARRTGCPVWVGRDRAAAAAKLVSCNPTVDILISDDGLQHYRLARNFEIAVIDARRLFGNRLLLPAGPLREPASRLETVDAAVVNGGEATAIPVSAFAMHLGGSEFLNLVDPSTRMPAGQFGSINLHAVAGIGNPERFFTHLRNLGLSFTPHAFPDHHVFTASDLEFAGADAVLMTEKDAIKCSCFARDIWWALPVDAQIDSALADAVIQKINQETGAFHGH
jgi:tetraacyldisaccharide 4'-kinase